MPRGLRSSSVSVPACDLITARAIDNPSPNPLLLFMPRAGIAADKRLEHVLLDGVGDAGPIVFDRDRHRRRDSTTITANYGANGQATGVNSASIVNYQS